MIDAFVSGWQRSFDYKGRSSRPDFWWFLLANFIALVILAILSGMAKSVGSTIYVIYAIAQIFPSLSLTVRRLRDAGKPWPWIFIQLVPFIGGIWLLVLLAQPSLPV